MSATWQDLPEELITRIGDFLCLTSKLNLLSCSRNEQNAIRKSKMFIKKVKIEFESSVSRLRIYEQNGSVSKIELARRTIHPYEECYYQLIWYLEEAFKYSKEPIEQFEFTGEDARYPEIINNKTLMSAPKIAFFCVDEHWEEWAAELPRGSSKELRVEVIEEDHHLELGFEPCFEWIPQLTFSGFSIVDLDIWKRFSNSEKIRLENWVVIKNLSVFFEKWCSSELPRCLRCVEIVDGQLGSLHRLRYQLRRDMRRMTRGGTPPEAQETFQVKRRQDGALADLLITEQSLSFTFDPNKYERRLDDWPVSDESDDDDARGFANLDAQRRRAQLLLGDYGLGPAYWH